MTATLVGLILRHVLTGFGAVMVAKGLPPTSAETICGAIAVLGGLVWSYIQKRRGIAE